MRASTDSTAPNEKDTTVKASGIASMTSSLERSATWRSTVSGNASLGRTGPSIGPTGSPSTGESLGGVHTSKTRRSSRKRTTRRGPASSDIDAPPTLPLRRSTLRSCPDINGLLPENEGIIKDGSKFNDFEQKLNGGKNPKTRKSKIKNKM